MRAPTEKYVWLFLVVSFFTALILVKFPDATWALYICCSLTVLTLIRLCFVPQTNKPRRGHYTMPLVPILPAVGIFFNFILACGLDAKTWSLFGVFLLIGITIYFSYGIWNSNLEIGNVTRGQLEMSLVSNTEHDGYVAAKNSDVIQDSIAKNYIINEVVEKDQDGEPEF